MVAFAAEQLQARAITDGRRLCIPRSHGIRLIHHAAWDYKQAAAAAQPCNLCAPMTVQGVNARLNIRPLLVMQELDNMHPDDIYVATPVYVLCRCVDAQAVGIHPCSAVAQT